jgi:hypothetical protein
LASEHFGFATDGRVYVEDARTFLNNTANRYDLIVHDTFTGGATPEHLVSLEVFQRTRSLLRHQGVLALNFVGYHEGPRAEASWAIARTLRFAFPYVRTFSDSPPAQAADSPGNLVFFASDSPLVFEVPAGARFESERCQKVLQSFQDWEVLRQVPPGDLITDGKNPLARLQLPIAEEHFKVMNHLLPSELWLRY